MDNEPGHESLRKQKAMFHFLLSFLLLIPSGMLISAGEAPPNHIGNEAHVPPASSVDLHLDHRIDRILRGGEFYNGLYLMDGGIEPGDHGEERPFISISLEVPGEIVDMEVGWKKIISVPCGPVPFLVPGVIGTDGEIDERWEDLPIVQERSWSLIRLSGMEVGGREGNLYSLKVYPLSFHGDVSGLSSEISVSYTCMDIGPFVFQMDEGHKPTGPVKYLIITDGSLVDAVKPLAVWKSRKGLLTRVITTREIKNTYSGRDTQEKMRNCVMDYEERFDLEYLLLAGDYAKVPTRNTRNSNPYQGYGEPNTFASDLYFACVDKGTNWNRDGDFQYAEVGEIDDGVPDMANGRLAIDSPSTMSLVISTLIRREKELEYNESANTAVMMAGDPTHIPGDPTDTVDHFWTEYGEDVFSDRETLYYDGSGTLSFSSSSFKQVVGDGYQAISYYSHGTQTGLPNLYNNNQVGSLSSDGPDGSFFVMACLTGWFDDPTQGSMGYFTECFGEVLTETNGKGVVGYMGASRLAVGQIDRVYSADAPGLEEDYWRSIHEAVNGNITANVGTVWKESVTHFSGSFYPFTSGGSQDVGLRTFLEYNLLGEPDAPLIFLEAENLSLEYAVSGDGSSVWASVTNETGGGVEDAVVTIYRYGELGRTMRTNSTGEATMTIPPNNGGTINITAYKEGFIHAQGTFDLVDNLEPLVLHQVIPENPDGLMGYYVTDPVVEIYGDEPCRVEYRWDDGGLQEVDGKATLTAPEGNHTLHFRVEDTVGLFSEWDEVSISVDTTPAEIGIMGDPVEPDGNGGVYISIPSVYITSPEHLGRAEYKINSFSRMDLTEPVPLYEGFNTVTMWGYDQAGNVNVTQSHFTADTTPPVSSIKVSHLPDGDNDFYVNVPFVEADELYGVDNILQYRWDDEEWAELDSEAPAPEGIHTLYHRGIDPAGNIETAQFRVFKVDTVGPELEMTLTPSVPDGDNGYYRTEPLVHVEIDEGEIHYILQELGGASDWGGPHQVMRGDLVMPDGRWTLHFRGIDEAGNVRYLESLDLKVDTYGPDLSYSVAPLDPDGENGWYRSMVVIRVDILSVNTTLSFRNGEEDWQGFTESLYLESGVYNLDIRALDAAGNELIRHLDLIKVDRDHPAVEMIGPVGEGVLGPDDVTVSWEGFDNTSGISLYQVSVDSGTWIDNGLISTYVIRSPSNGRHTVTVRVFDHAGNFELGGLQFEVDSISPYIMYKSPVGPNISIDSTVLVTFSEEMDRTRFSFSVDGVEGNLSWEGDTAVFTPEMLLCYGKTYEVVVTGMDTCGNEMDRLNWSFSTVALIPEEREDEEGGFGAFIAAVVVVLVLIVVLGTVGIIMLYIRKRERISEEIWEDSPDLQGDELEDDESVDSSNLRGINESVDSSYLRGGIRSGLNESVDSSNLRRGISSGEEELDYEPLDMMKTYSTMEEEVEELDPVSIEEEFTEFYEVGSSIEDEIDDEAAPPEMEDVFVMESPSPDDLKADIDEFPHHKGISKDDDEFIDLEGLF